MSDIKYPAYYFEWQDHAIPSGSDKAWQSLEDLEDEPSVVKTVAYLVKETKDAYLVVHSYCLDLQEDGSYGNPEGIGLFSILKSATKKARKLKVPV